ncbi:NADH-ubiquinone oxidoreductase 21 subunit [Candida viswanathii]|uniref:NADH-ubiquinone oxidoreductase 21 subunit n=1 Tax=Candida viswanathii TaxID=5486 RepID=A0A367YJH0_9ASCO|nr:NADH-ubiquinone oxidoreductase 21 subunit [Candida viswanathii]
MSGGPVPVWKKYTTRPQGIWEKIRQLLVLVPNRSSGNPLVSLFRASPPGDRIQQAKEYKDPITIPAGDIKGNPYFKRDYRRNYPQVHTFNQTKVSGLLNLGSAANPRISIGDKGNKELEVFTNGNDVSLSSTLKAVPATVVKGEILGKTGEPIVAPSLNKFKWEILSEPVSGMYTSDYPCRIFTDKKVNVVGQQQASQ